MILTKNYKNSNLLFAKNNIFEYDIRSAGLSMCKEYNLLPQDVISDIESIKDKKNRMVYLGNISKDRKDLVINIEKYINKAVQAFVKFNNITNVIYVKNDAICYKGEPAEYINFGDNIEFMQKIKAESYLKMCNNIELLLVEQDLSYETIIKGFSRDNKILEWIKSMMIYSLTHTEKEIFIELGKFRHNYLTHNVDIEYYRELNVHNKYRLKRNNSENKLYLSEYPLDINDLDITYNNINVISYLIKTLK